MAGNGHLLIRADASVEMGTGHIMRCLALAQAWRAEGGDVTFVMRDSLLAALHARLQQENVQVIFFNAHSNPGSLDDAQETIGIAKNLGCKQIIVDGYHFDAAYQESLKNAGLCVLFIDDNEHTDFYWADFILNQNSYANQLMYHNRHHKTQLLLGTSYALLRREFWEWRGWRRDIVFEARKILVTMGGSDPKNVTAKVAEALRETSLEVVLVIGASNPHYDQIQRIVAYTSMRLENNVTNMPELMRWADMAITATGTTTWELAMMGLPSLSVIIAANQRRIGAWLQQRELAVVLGEADVVTPGQIRDAVSDLSSNMAQRQRMSLIGQAVVDGCGAQRVVGILIGSLSGLKLRVAVAKDAALIWWWANDPQTRENSFNAAPISWETHTSWYTQQLESSSVRFWMLEDGGVPVGHIRYQLNSENPEIATISFTIGPQHRGKGYGTRMLNMTKLRACEELSIGKVRGITFMTNKASARAFQKAGFAQMATELVGNHPCFVFEWER